MTARYDGIMNLPYPNSSKHPRMTALGRAAQFLPFAALTGFEGTIRETARLTDSKAELDENKVAALDMKLRFLLTISQNVRRCLLPSFRLIAKRKVVPIKKSQGLSKK